MGRPLDKLTIKGFKSIEGLEDFELRKLNVLIGGNGAGKTNFIDLFRMLRAMMELSLPELRTSNLDAYITNGGGIDDFLFNGPKETEDIFVQLMFGPNGYRFNLVPTASEDYNIEDESRYYEYGSSGWWNMGGGYKTPKLLIEKDKTGAIGHRSIASYIYNSIESWCIYHFHDTSKKAPMRRSEIIEDNAYLRFDASNIASYLLRLREEGSTAYEDIVETVRAVTPFFDDFLLAPVQRGEKTKVNLSWTQKGSDYPMQPYHLSDGTIRFICLATALLQPGLPSTIIIDEPELGLHPFAIDILAELMQSTAQRTQLIISTQSPALVDNFNPEDVIVVNRKDGASTFERLEPGLFDKWLEEYSLGDLWRKNVVTGGPSYE